MRSVHLLISGLQPDFGPNAESMLAGVDLPGLRRLQARGRVAEVFEGEHPPGLSQRLAEIFGGAAGQELPIAPLRLALDGVDPGDGQWFCADPVHLLLMLDHLRMGGTPAISNEESTALVEWLNQNFDGEAEFIAPTPAHWYVRFSRPLHVTTTPPDSFSGESIEPFLPAGEDAKYLRRLSNEIQMLLHAHPLRESREERGEPVINSVWFWGGGVRAEPGQACERVFSDEPISQALALAGQVPWISRPAQFNKELIEPGRTLVVINTLQAAAAQGDFATWRAEIERLDRDWFKPLLEALMHGHIDEVVFESTGKAAATWRLRRWDAWKFWKG